jgi:NTE family protein
MSRPIELEYVASEGSTFVFDALELLLNKHANNKKSSDEDDPKFESCDQKRDDEIQVSNIRPGQDGRIYWFKAPYLRNENAVTSTLNFKVKIVGQEISYEAKVLVKRVQRAIIFQGGVALGAYEAGVLQTLVQELNKKEEDQVREGLKDKKRPLFDIIAGTSIGAMNAAIVASNVIKHGSNGQDSKSWNNAVESVRQFWDSQKYELPTLADIAAMNPIYQFWWDNTHNTSKILKSYSTELLENSSRLFAALYSNLNPNWDKWYNFVARYWFQVDPSFMKDYLLNGWYVPATAEAARRYYSAKQFGNWGTLNVATGIIPWSIFGSFFDFSDTSNSRPRVDNKHFVLFSLKETLERLGYFPMKIERDQQIRERQPRFLLVTVDVKTGDAVTFDSYSEETKYHDDKNVIKHGRGIEVEHVLASGTFPNFFDYPKFRVEHSSKKNDNDSNQQLRNEEHTFWDGGYQSNTPLREVIQAHRDYWHKIREHNNNDDEDKKENDVPDLEVYIADLWPSELKEEPISYDLDFVENRKHDLLLADRTDYDEKVADIVTDYVDLVKRLKNLAQKYGASEKELNHILERDATSKNTEGVTRKYKELLGGRFRLTKVVRIDHKDDGNNVAGKIFDYSYKTVEKLIEKGNRDARIQMDMQSLKDQVRELAERHTMYNGKEKKEVLHIQEFEKYLNQIQGTIKIGNSYDTLIDQISHLVNEVKSIEVGDGDGLLLKEEKASLISLAEQFQETIADTQNGNLRTSLV